MKWQHLFLVYVGIYLILDGIISIIHFYDSATQLEQAIRLIRASLGVILVCIYNK